MADNDQKRMMSLKVKITLITSVILFSMAAVLTVISIQNARVTYGNQISLSIGEDLKFTLNEHELVLDGDDDLEEIFDFIGGFGKKSESSSSDGVLRKANLSFARKSIGFMILISVVGTLIIYFVVKRAFNPVKQLDEGIRNVNDTNLNQPVVIQTRDKEIVSLEKSFNTMIAKLDESFQMQKNFAANAAHELKTPLATMKAGIQVLRMEENPKVEDYMETIDVMDESTHRLIRVVEDLLDLTKEEGNGYNDRIILKEMLDIVTDELEITAKEKEVDVVVACCNGVIKGNSVLVYRVLFNLIENAIKYNKKGGKVTITSTVTQDKVVSITIADNGIGMMPEEISHIFEPFYRVDKSRSREMGGSGLGLSIVKKIIDKHNGIIYVNSMPNWGTTFTIQFPMV